MFGEAPLPDAAIAAVLADEWSIEGGMLEYRRVGYGSYHWLAGGAGARRWFVTVDAVDGMFPARHAYSVAHRLAAAGLEFVRAPRPASDGRIVVEVGDWLVSLWPWIDGAWSTSQQHASATELAATLRCVRRLHDLGSVEPVPELVEDWELMGRRQLSQLLVGKGWGSGPYAEEARALILRGADRIERDLARYDELVAEVIAAGVEFVVTHGEPHAGNVVHTATGPVLIDWDTVLWAPRERDLWSLIDEDWHNGYGSYTPSLEAVELYRLQWELSEIADFGRVLSSVEARNPDSDLALLELRRYLGD